MLNPKQMNKLQRCIDRIIRPQSHLQLHPTQSHYINQGITSQIRIAQQQLQQLRLLPHYSLLIAQYLTKSTQAFIGSNRNMQIGTNNMQITSNHKVLALTQLQKLNISEQMKQKYVWQNLLHFFYDDSSHEKYTKPIIQTICKYYRYSVSNTQQNHSKNNNLMECQLLDYQLQGHDILKIFLGQIKVGEQWGFTHMTKFLQLFTQIIKQICSLLKLISNHQYNQKITKITKVILYLIQITIDVYKTIQQQFGLYYQQWLLIQISKLICYINNTNCPINNKQQCSNKFTKFINMIAQNINKKQNIQKYNYYQSQQQQQQQQQQSSSLLLLDEQSLFTNIFIQLYTCKYIQDCRSIVINTKFPILLANLLHKLTKYSFNNNSSNNNSNNNNNSYNIYDQQLTYDAIQIFNNLIIIQSHQSHQQHQSHNFKLQILQHKQWLWNILDAYTAYILKQQSKYITFINKNTNKYNTNIYYKYNKQQYQYQQQLKQQYQQQQYESKQHKSKFMLMNYCIQKLTPQIIQQTIIKNKKLNYIALLSFNKYHHHSHQNNTSLIIKMIIAQLQAFLHHNIQLPVQLIIIYLKYLEQNIGLLITIDYTNNVKHIMESNQDFTQHKQYKQYKQYKQHKQHRQYKQQQQQQQQQQIHLKLAYILFELPTIQKIHYSPQSKILKQFMNYYIYQLMTVIQFPKLQQLYKYAYTMLTVDPIALTIQSFYPVIVLMRQYYTNRNYTDITNEQQTQLWILFVQIIQFFDQQSTNTLNYQLAYIIAEICSSLLLKSKYNINGQKQTSIIININTIINYYMQNQLLCTQTAIIYGWYLIYCKKQICLIDNIQSLSASLNNIELQQIGFQITNILAILYFKCIILQQQQHMNINTGAITQYEINMIQQLGQQIQNTFHQILYYSNSNQQKTTQTTIINKQQQFTKICKDIKNGINLLLLTNNSLISNQNNIFWRLCNKIQGTIIKYDGKLM